MHIPLGCLLRVTKTCMILCPQHPLGFFFVFCFAFLSLLTSLSCQNHFLEIAGESACEGSRFADSSHQRKERVLAKPELRRGRGWHNGSEDSRTSWKTTSFYLDGDRSPGFIVYWSQMGSKNVCLQWEISLIPYSLHSHPLGLDISDVMFFSSARFKAFILMYQESMLVHTLIVNIILSPDAGLTTKSLMWFWASYTVSQTSLFSCL